MIIKRFFSFTFIFLFLLQSAHAGVLITRSNGITLTGADGVKYVGTNGITLTGADGFLNYQSNGITLTGADGITLTGADGITLTGADGHTYTGANGINLTGADGITLTGADGITLTGADGITLTGADGSSYQADSIVIRRPNGITLTGADGITLTGADGITLTGADGINLTGADGITLTGADGITLTGADSAVAFRADGTSFNANPNGITLTGADGITLTGADGITLTGADYRNTQYNGTTQGLQSVDPEFALLLNQMTDDSNVNAVIVFHNYPTASDLTQLQQNGITGGTLYKKLPMISVTAKKSALIAASKLSNVRSIYGNRTLDFNADPFLRKTNISRIAVDRDLQTKNAGMPVSGRNVTVAVLDTGVNSIHNDLTGRVIQNVRLVDLQSTAVGFINPLPVENVQNTDPVSGHGTFVAGVVAGSGQMSGGKYSGVAPGAKILGLSAGDVNLSNVLAGFDYLLERGASYNVRVVNCSFSSNTVFDFHDPVNVASKMLTERGVNVVFSAGNAGAGNGTLNPYAVAPWVISVGATDEKSRLAGFSSRGVFGSDLFRPTLVAPGVNIIGLRGGVSQTGVLGVVTGGDGQRLTAGELPFYTTASGTSFSAPQVAGAVALMLEINPNLTPAQIKDILSRTSTALPNYYGHEVGAGMLNTYAAVLESAFPNRRTGYFRADLERRAVNFSTSVTQRFSHTVVPGESVAADINIPANTVQAGVHISWNLSSNDLGLKLFSADGNIAGESNFLNASGFTGRREKVVVENPAAQTMQAVVRHTGNLGTAQQFFGAVETTRVNFAPLGDLQTLSPEAQSYVYESLRSYLMLPQGSEFKPAGLVTRADLAMTLVRGGFASQYVASNPLFSDISDLTTRNAVESVQSRQEGKLIFDATNGGAFRPDGAASKLVLAVALVKAAELDGQAAGSVLPASVLDGNFIPAHLRGYVALGLQKGWVSLDGNNFNQNRPVTRLELAEALVKLSRSAGQ